VVTCIVLFRGLNVGGRHASAMSREVERRHGFEPQVGVLTQSECQAAIDQCSFDTAVGKDLHLFFLAEEPGDLDRDRLAELKAASEAYALRGRVFYLHAPAGIGRSRLVARIGGCLRTSMTARNWNTVSKLLAMLD
jgi:uncharacterized protein (DUF1697 family)